MLIILPVLSLVCIFLSIISVKPWREAVLITALIAGGLVTAMTEVLSAGGVLTKNCLALTWGIVSLSAGSVVWRRRESLPSLDIMRGWDMWRAQDRLTRVLLVGIALLLFATGIIALIAPPNDWDSMTYHLSRTVHWQEQQRVSHYATHNIRQLYMNPWAEFAMLHTILLSGGDQAALSIQWLSFVGAIVGLTLIVEQFGTTRGSVLITVVTAVTVPMGIVQAASTQNNHVVALWLIIVIYFILQANRTEQLGLYHAAVIGTGSSLAILTKGTAYVYLLPFWLWLALVWFRRMSLRALMLPGAVMVMIALVLNAGHWLRNYDLFGDPLGPQTATNPDHSMRLYRNEVWGPAPFISNVTRNLALHLGTSYPPVETALSDAIITLHDWLGLDPSDPRTTWQGTTFAVGRLKYDQQYTNNPVHLLLFLITFGWIAANRRRLKSTPVTGYATALLLAFGLFCLVFKWQPWHSRLHLPLFLLSAPLTGYMLARMRNNLLVKLIGLLLLGAAGLWLYWSTQDLRNTYSSPRGQQYFASRPDLITPYVRATELIAAAGCDSIGFFASEDAWEYPIWTLLAEHGDPDAQLQHVEVGNISRTKENAAFEPCAVLVIDRQLAPDPVIHGTRFDRAAQWGTISVWLPADTAGLILIGNTPPGTVRLSAAE